MYETTIVEISADVAKRVRDAMDIVDATAVVLEFFYYSKDIGYKRGREDEKESNHHGEAVRI